jgi:hypothetical protein
MPNLLRESGHHVPDYRFDQPGGSSTVFGLAEIGFEGVAAVHVNGSETRFAESSLARLV